MNNIKPPIWCKDAVPSAEGWRDKKTNELLVAMKINMRLFNKPKPKPKPKPKSKPKVLNDEIKEDLKEGQKVIKEVIEANNNGKKINEEND